MVSLVFCLFNLQITHLTLRLHVLPQNSKVPDDVASEMMDLCSVIELVADVHNVVKLVTDCSFLYWSRDIMPACFKMLYRKTGEARHLQYVSFDVVIIFGIPGLA